MPFEIPCSWEYVQVEDLFELNPKSNLPDETKVGFVPMALVEDGFSGKHTFEVKQWKDVKKGYCHFQNGDIGVAKISPCFENLKSTIFENLPSNHGAGTTELVILRPSSFVVPKFYLYLFKSLWYNSEGTKYFKGVVGQQRVHKGIFTDLKIPLPPLAEQHRILAEVERLFTLIDKLECNKSDLQNVINQTKSKILDLAIHGKLVPQDANDEPAIELLKRINPDFTPCDNGHYPQLPDRWAVCRLEQVVDYEQPTAYIVNSTAYDDSYSIPVLTAGKSFIIGYTNETTGIYSNLPCIIFDDFTTDSRLVDFPFKVKSSAMKILKICKDIEIDYIAMFMSITRLVGDTHKRYWISEYSKLEIPIPPKAEQKRIVYAVRNLFAQLDVIMESL